MLKQQNRWGAVRRYISTVLFGILRKRVSVEDAGPDDIGFTGAQGSIYVSDTHPVFEHVTESEKRTIQLGVGVHEALHKVFTNFDYLKEKTNALKANGTFKHDFDKKMFCELWNLIEDPAIESHAHEKCGGTALRALYFAIEKLDLLSRELNGEIEKPYPFMELFSALCEFGDMGIVTTEFHFPEAQEVFAKIAPTFYDAINEPDNRKRIDMTEDIYKEARPLWENTPEAQLSEFLEKLAEMLQKMSKDSGENGLYKSGSGKNAGSSSEDTPLNRRRKISIKKVTRDEYNRMKEEAKKAEKEEVDPDADIEIVIPEDFNEEDLKESMENPDDKGPSISIPLPMPSDNEKGDDDSEGSEGSEENSEDAEGESSGSKKGTSKGKSKSSKAGKDKSEDGESEDGSGGADDEESEEGKAGGKNSGGDSSEEEDESEDGGTAGSGASEEDAENGMDECSSSGGSEDGEADGSSKDGSSEDNEEGSAMDDYDMSGEDSDSEFGDNSMDMSSSSYNDSSSNTDEGSSSDSTVDGSLDNTKNFDMTSRVNPHELTDEEAAQIEDYEYEPEISDEDIMNILDGISKEEIEHSTDDEESENYYEPIPELTNEIASEFPQFEQVRCTNRYIEDDRDLSDQYDEVLENLSEYIEPLKDELKDIFYADRVKKMYSESGKVNVRRLATKKTLTVFERRIQPEHKDDVAFCVVVDNSGSTSGEKVKQEKLACIGIAEALAEYNIPLYVFSFQTFYQNDDTTQTHYVRWDNTRFERERILYMQANGGNFDSYSIRYGTKLLEERKERKKILIVISDGCPTDWFSGYEGIKQNRLAIEDARAEKINVLGIGVGSVDDGAFTEMYTKDYYLKVQKPSDLFDNLAERIVKFIDEGE